MDEQALNELLECSVCLEPLDATSKVLPCQHTFCRRCLEEIVSTKEELRCPECRTIVLVKVEDLPPNILLIRLLEGMKTASVKTSAGESGEATRSGQDQVGAGSSAGSSQSRASPVQKSAVSIHQPCARALYNYDGTEPGDLSFKKGDIVTLRKQVDENWYHGELNGQHGFFPAVYVQIVNPLPQEIPKCKALYDFYIEDENEKDCLAFSKDCVLTVIRRIDDNWIEGRLGEKIGIFPIAFVELNDAAKYLVNSQHNKSCTSGSPAVGSPSGVQARSAFTMPGGTSGSNSAANSPSPGPATPSSASGSDITVTSTTAAPSGGSATRTTVASPRTTAVSPRTTAVSPRTTSMSSSMHGSGVSVTGTVIPVTSVVPSSRGRCMSPVQAGAAAAASVSLATTLAPSVMLSMQTVPYSGPPGGGVTVRSMQHAGTTSVPSSMRPLQHPLVSSVQASQRSPQKRHSLTTLTPQTTSPSDAHQRRSLEVTTLSYSTANSSAVASVASVTPAVQLTTVTSASAVSQVPEAHMPPGISSPPSYTPTAIYHALYNYKPQKDDELELHKGDFYTVSEKCQDGWFKGRCLRTGNIGVFPGNYVQVVKASLSRHSNMRSHNQHRSHGSSSATQQSKHNAMNIAVSAMENNNVTVNGNSPAADYQVRPGMSARQSGGHSRSHHADAALPGGESGQLAMSSRMAPVGAASQPISKSIPHRHRMLPQSQVINSQNMVVVDGPPLDNSSHALPKGASGTNGNHSAAPPGGRPERSSSAKAEKSLSNKHEKMSASKGERSGGGKSDKRTAVVVPVQIPALPIRSPPSDGAAAPEGGSIVNNNSKSSSSSSSPHHNTPVPHPAAPGLMVRSDCAVTPSRSRSPHGQRVHRSASSGRSKQHLHGQQSMDSERARSASSHMNAHSVSANANMVPPNATAAGIGDGPCAPVTTAVQNKEREKKERKEKEKISLMKRLTKSKKSRSSPPTVEAESPETEASHQRTASLPAESLEGAAASLPIPLPAGGVALHKKSGSLDSPSGPSQKAAKIKPLMRERYRCIVPFPPNTDAELELKVGDIVYVYKKREDGWFKGTLQRTGKSGLFPGSFVESF